ncbi:energy-converting NiFe hydrogenase A subunit EhaA [Methanocaldococcus infernus]
MLLYVLSAIVSMGLAFLFKMPLKPRDKFSFEASVIFPTPILALGFYAIFKHLFYPSLFFSVLAGILGFLLSKYSDKLFGES